jgi:hypothetical protein
MSATMSMKILRGTLAGVSKTASARMTTTLETGQLDTEKSEQTPRQRARYEIDTYVQDAELEDPRVQAP